MALEPIKSINIELEQPMAHDLDAKHWILKTHSRFDGLALEQRLALEPIKSINIELEQPIAHNLDAKH